MQITVSRLQEQDIDAVADAAVEFFYESDNRDLTLRSDKYKDLLRSHIGHPYVASFVAKCDGEVSGYVHVYVQADFTDEFVGELYQFYVREKFRGTQVARSLVSAADEWFKSLNCVRAYSEVGHGVESSSMSSKLFENLWSKFGYQAKGTVLKKDY